MFAEELLKTGKHMITAITRADSKSSPPAGVQVAKVNYDDDGESLVAALQGQQFLVITLSAMAAPDTHGKIVKAAAKAGVPYIMPNVYGGDKENKKLNEENLVGVLGLQRCAEVEDAGASYIAMICGFWYEWSLSLGEAFYGFDLRNRKATFFDDGKTLINTSTWPQCGRALAALLSLPINDASPSVSQWKNKALYISSFKVSQRDMLDSIHRVTGTTDKDWEISYEPSEKRYEEGKAAMMKGDRMGFAKALYSRSFYPNGDGEFESKRGLANEALGLPKEDLDEATKSALKLVESGWNPFGQ